MVRRGRSFAAPIVIAVVCITAGVLTATAGAGVEQPPTGNVLRRWAAVMGGGEANQVLTPEGAAFNARTYDMVVVKPSTAAPFLPDMRAANPDVVVIAYVNGAYATRNQGEKYPTDWYARDAEGRQITSTEEGHYLMDVSHQGWVTSRVDECGRDLASGFDGCYLDVLGVATLEPGYVTSPPINPATGAIWTNPDFIGATSALATAVKSAHPTKAIVANGLAKGDLYFDPAAGPTSRLLDGIDGGNAQGWIRGTGQAIDRYRAQASWRNDVDLLVDAGRRGKSALAMTKVWGVPRTAAQAAAVHRYALASFLLGTDGNQYFFFSDTDGQAAVAPDYAYDHVNVGMPLGPYVYKQRKGVFVRSFTNGIAVVNPTDHPVRYGLGAKYRSLDGVVTRAADLPPNSGDVYVPV